MLYSNLPLWVGVPLCTPKITPETWPLSGIHPEGESSKALEGRIVVSSTVGAISEIAESVLLPLIPWNDATSVKSVGPWFCCGPPLVVEDRVSRLRIVVEAESILEEIRGEPGDERTALSKLEIFSETGEELFMYSIDELEGTNAVNN